MFGLYLLDAVLLASSEHCKNEAFSYNSDKVIATQFHPEMTFQGI